MTRRSGWPGWGCGLAGNRTRDCASITGIGEDIGRERVFTMWCCSAWADRAWGPRCWRRPSRGAAIRSSWCWIHRSGSNRARNVDRPRPHAVHRLQQVRRTIEPKSCSNISLPGSRSGGRGEGGPRFLAVTDPGSKLEKVAAKEGFARILYGDPSIGGRYSVLSNFGMVPAAAIGLELGPLLESPARWSVRALPLPPRIIQA